MLARLPTFVFVLLCLAASAIGAFIFLIVAAIISLLVGLTTGGFSEHTLFSLLAVLGLIVPVPFSCSSKEADQK
jgi:hypothetical protein